MFKYRVRQTPSGFSTTPTKPSKKPFVNALYHRSYQNETPVEVRIFPSRIEIINYPGPFPPLNRDNLNKITESGLTALKYRAESCEEGNRRNETEVYCSNVPRIK